MLRTSELSAMRRTMNSSFADTCDILGNVGAQNALGQQSDNWQPVNKANGVVVPVPCRVVPLGGNDESDVANATTSSAEASIIVPFNTVVGAANRIRIYGSGVVYEVNYRHPAQSEDLSLLCDCKLVE